MDVCVQHAVQNRSDQSDGVAGREQDGMPKGDDDGDEIRMDGWMEEWNGMECLLSLFSLPSRRAAMVGDSTIKMDCAYCIFRTWDCRARPVHCNLQ